MTVNPPHLLSPWEHLHLQMRVLQAVMSEAEPALAELGLDSKGFFLLCVLEEHPSPAAAAEALMLPRPTATSLIKRAEAAGHLQRRTVPGDLRRFHLSLTDQGRQARERGQQILDQVVGRRLARLDHQQRVALEDTLKRIAETP